MAGFTIYMYIAVPRAIDVDIFRRDFRVPMSTLVVKATDGILQVGPKCFFFVICFLSFVVVLYRYSLRVFVQNNGETIALYRPIAYAPSINSLRLLFFF